MRVGIGNLNSPDIAKRYVTVSLSWDETKALASGGIQRSMIVNGIVSGIETEAMRRFGMKVQDEPYSGNGIAAFITETESE